MKNTKKQVAAAEVAAATTVEAPAKKVTSREVKVSFFGPMFEEGKMTAKEILAKALESGNFPKLSESTLRTMITDSKNPKYNIFPHLVVKGADGKLSYQKEA